MEVSTLSEQLFFTTVHIETTYPPDTDGHIQTGVGTGFLYLVPIGGPDSGALFVVTNKHVIAGASSAVIRFIRSADPERAKPLLGQAHGGLFRNPDDLFVGHPDPAVDVAVLRISGFISKLDSEGNHLFFRALTASQAMTDKNVSTVDALEQVTFIGYPDGLYDQANYLPIARRGSTATPPSIDYEGKPMFLIDASVFPGSSGSPVLIAEANGVRRGKSNDIRIGGTRIMLLGVVAKFYERAVPVAEVEAVKSVLSMEGLNIGIVYKASAIDETCDIVLARRGLRRHAPIPEIPVVVTPSPEQDPTSSR